MQEMTMITVTSDRVPCQTYYEAKICVDLVTEIPGQPEVESVWDVKMICKMEEIIAELHRQLQKCPNAKVTMVLGSETESQFGQKQPRAFELDEKMRNTIRDDLEKGQAMFAPIVRTIKVRPESPRIEIKENEHEQSKQTEL